MSLRVWLPLTKDLRNQGLDDVTATAKAGVTIDSNGKLGKCYNFASSSTGNLTLSSQINVSIINGASVAAWIYLNGTNSDRALFSNQSGGPVNFSFEINSSKLSVHHYNGSWLRHTGTTTLSTGKWYHIAYVCKNSKCTFYIDGVPESTIVDCPILSNYSGTIPLDCLGSRWSNSAPFAGKINDFRLYDHCLSPMEVKELAKGLVLHYPLNRNGWGQENLATQYVVPGSNGPLVTTTAGRTVYYGKYGITIPTTESADTYFSIYMKQALESGKKYTLSCEVNGLSNGTYYNFPLFAQNNSSMGLLKLDHNGLCSLTFTMNYTGTVATSTVDGVTLYRLFMDDISRSIASGQGAITVTNIKLEEGDKVTPWCPASTDSSYTTMGLNGTTEYDCSGFCNNGTRTGTFSWTSDTPKYEVSTHIVNTSTKIHITNLTTSGFGNSYSFAWWGKRTSNSPMFWGFSDGCRLNGMYTGTLWNTGDGSNNPIYKPGTTTTITAPSVNVWHHYVMTGDGTICKLYVDGVLYGQAKTYKAISGTSIWINGWNDNTSYSNDNMDISDFRIYATALSADDVKSLYQNSAYIDSSGNVYGTIHES